MVNNGWIRVWSTVLLETILLFVGIESSVNLGDTKDWFPLDPYVFDEDFFATFGKFLPTLTNFGTHLFGLYTVGRDVWNLDKCARARVFFGESKLFGRVKMDSQTFFRMLPIYLILPSFVVVQ